MQFSHLDASGRACMVDVSGKSETTREARAECTVTMTPETFAALVDGKNPKGDVFAASRIAGIMGAKKCADLIPLCHPLSLSKVDIDFTMDEDNSQVIISSFCKLKGQTGVEMEALTAVSVASLCFFDMCKAVDPKITISNMRVIAKRGGKSGNLEFKP